MTGLLVALGGALGAALRYLVDALLSGMTHQRRFPAGTLAVNVLGSAALGAVLGAAPGTAWTALLATGVCGALTTYSTFSVETLALLEERRPGVAAAYSLGSLALGLAGFAAAFAAASALA